MPLTTPRLYPMLFSTVSESEESLRFFDTGRGAVEVEDAAEDGLSAREGDDAAAV